MINRRSFLTAAGASAVVGAASAASAVQPSYSQWEVNEAYLEWLLTEARLLQAEMYSGSKFEGGPVGTLAAHYHFPVRARWQDVPKPSTRASLVLSSVGAI